MSANQLPENMGKKIVEALKKQALMEEQTPSVNNYNVKEEPFSVQNEIIEETVLPVADNALIQEINEPEEEKIQTKLQTQSNFVNNDYSQKINETPMQFSLPNGVPQRSEIMYNAYSPELPTNVAVLKKLIMQLPAGVSKQVGAQIIRQTIEALGISMNSVLQEAQQVQEGLNSSVTDCTIKIQEYKNQIMQLEANTRDYQRQMAQINDLISLFILTDNKK